MKKSLPIAAGLAAALLLTYFVINTVKRQPSLNQIYAEGIRGKDATGKGTSGTGSALEITREYRAYVKEPSLTDTFNQIYAEGIWAKDATGKGTSGTGSSLEITRWYRAYLEHFIKKHGVKSVVDAGCGDWSFSKAMDWGDVSYLGVDIASDVIEAVRKKHGRGKFKFQLGDITEELPAADLLISKDVLQHLSNDLIHKFIKNNLRKGKYKWVILTNDRSSENRDIETGDYRMIDLAAPPFEVKGLVDLPIKFGKQARKITSLLDLTQQP
jgi:SAM-dependent methyltransferase